jgi:hypothetical protein
MRRGVRKKEGGVYEMGNSNVFGKGESSGVR